MTLATKIEQDPIVKARASENARLFQSLLEQAEKRQDERVDRGDMQNPNVDLCPYGECAGHGVILNPTGTKVVRFCKCYQLRVAKGRLHFAQTPEEFRGLSVRNFDLSFYRGPGYRTAEIAKASANHYLKDFKHQRALGKGLYIYSQTTGSGKTRLALSIANDIMRHYQTAIRFVTTIGLLNEIKGKMDEDKGPNQLIELLKAVPVLVLDDIGAEAPTQWASELFFDLINERMVRRKVTIFTSNREIAHISTGGERVRERIKRVTYPVSLPNVNVRDQIGTREAQAFFSTMTTDPDEEWIEVDPYFEQLELQMTKEAQDAKPSAVDR